MGLSENIPRQPKARLFIFGLSMILIIGYIDYLTGREIAISVFYMLPITFLTWYIGKKSGYLASILAALTWYFADAAGNHRYYLKLVNDWNELVRLAFFFITVFILSRLKQEYEKQKIMAREDYLTGVYNSRAFYDLAGIELERARRNGHPLTLAYLDMDDFKVVNDRLGHTEGDNLLRSLVEKIKINIRPYDIIARLGGDEFAVLFPESDQEPALAILQRMMSGIAELMKDKQLSVTFSVGAATYVRPPDSIEEMVMKADSLMYEAKSAGKNMIRHETFDQGRELPE